MKDLVLFSEVTCINGKKIGIATLNAPQKLNALGLPMIQLLTPKLTQWQQQSDIALVILQGQGERAFCAGGDIVGLYSEMIENQGEYTDNVEAFFSQEYQLDYLIHTFNKPLLVWGSGIVMGGGLGLLIGASHRVVTETTRMAMPEINIGLFPDVGGSWFLSHLPDNLGYFLGLTGAQINAADAKQLNIATHFVTEGQQLNILDALVAMAWGDTIALNHEKLSTILQEFELHDIVSMPAGMLRDNQQELSQILANSEIATLAQRLIEHQSESEWLTRSINNLRKGSPLSACIIAKQLELGASLSLADCFRLELNLALRCAQHGEFAEGVRALLVDKDKSPNWQHKDIQLVDKEIIDWFFTPIFDAENHPLKHLGL